MKVLEAKPAIKMKFWSGPVSIRGHGNNTYEGEDGRFYFHDLATDLWYVDIAQPHKPLLDFS